MAKKRKAETPDGGDNKSSKVERKTNASQERICPLEVDPRRVRLLSGDSNVGEGAVVYWMSRDQRVQDNWALIHACNLARSKKTPVHVVFCLLPSFLGATLRHFAHMLAGLAEVEASLHKLGIPFELLLGEPRETITGFVEAHAVAAVVTDYSPLRVARRWKSEVGSSLGSVPLFEVDAHNVVPVWEASGKQEVGARTLRPKITKLLPTFLTEFPVLQNHPFPPAKFPTPVDWAAALESLKVDRSVGKCTWCKPGEAAAAVVLEEFVSGGRLKKFENSRNDPTEQALSNLSPYFHFGQLAPQRAALYVRERGRSYSGSVASFIEEMVVRRELADNYCHYQEHYDSLEGAAQWAQDSLQKHASDPRDFLYSQADLEAGRTHDALWNAAQLQMVNDGKMHGFLRMYWAKKVLEWTDSPEEALRIAIYLNDKFSLDGRDPNGYVGCMWSIAGVHDMGWAERAVFGKIRYMNYNGCKRKFDVKGFESKYPQAVKNAAAAVKKP